MNVHQTDAQGYLIPRMDLEADELTELGWSVPGGDPDFGPAESWPQWTDEGTWEEGPAIPPDAAIEPFEPSPEDEADYREWAAEVERRWCDERIERDYPGEYPASHVTDEDLRAAGLAVG